MAYWEWGDPAASHVVVCVHGLARQGRDFDVLAQALLDRSTGPVRVVCPDVVGRGRSDWLQDAAHYQIPTYVADVLTLMAQLAAEASIERFDWVGTSMGGLIGMVLAGTPELQLPAPLRKLVLNDVGPAIQWDALQRIGTYLGNTGRFATLEEAAGALLLISKPFGPHTPEQWLALSRGMVRPREDGALTLHYDPAIAMPFRALTREAAAQGEAAVWAMYDRIRAEVLLTRGAQSDLLSRDTALAMAGRGPRARLVEFEGVGHAPTFVDAAQVNAVVAFLLDSHEEPVRGTS